MKPIDELHALFLKCTDTNCAYALIADAAEAPNAFVSLHTRDGKYIAVSESVTDLLQYVPADLVGNSAYDYFLARDFEAIMASHARVAVQADVTTVSYGMRCKDSTYKFVTTQSKTVVNLKLSIHEILAFTYLQE
jgi:PAS domain-containing protein